MWQICAFKLWAKTMGKLCKRHLLRKSYGWKPWKLTAGEIVGVDGEARHRRRRKNHSRGVQIALQRGRKMRKTSGRGQQNSPPSENLSHSCVFESPYYCVLLPNKIYGVNLFLMMWPEVLSFSMSLIQVEPHFMLSTYFWWSIAKWIEIAIKLW